MRPRCPAETPRAWPAWIAALAILGACEKPVDTKPAAPAAAADITESPAPPPDLTACTPDGPCLQVPDHGSGAPDWLRNKVRFGNDGAKYCAMGARFGQMPGTLHLGDREVAVAQWWPEGVCWQGPFEHLRDGDVWLETADGAVSNRVPFVTSPWLDAVEPADALPGDIVTLTGGNFGDDPTRGELIRSGDAGIVLEWTDTRIRFALVTMAYGDAGIRATKAKGGIGMELRSNEVALSVAPRLTSGCRVAPGEQCVLTGQGLGFQPVDGSGANQVRVAGQAVAIQGWAPLLVTIELPATLPMGSLEVELTTSNGRTAQGTVERLAWRRADVTWGNPYGTGVYAHPGAVYTSDQYTWMAHVHVPIAEHGLPGEPALGLTELQHDASVATPGSIGKKVFGSVDGADAFDGRPRLMAADGHVWLAARVLKTEPGPGQGKPKVPYAVRLWRRKHGAKSANLEVFGDIVDPQAGQHGDAAGLVRTAGSLLWLALRDDDAGRTHLFARRAGVGSSGQFEHVTSLDATGALMASDPHRIWLAPGEADSSGHLVTIDLPLGVTDVAQMIVQAWPSPEGDGPIDPARMPLTVDDPGGRLWAVYVTPGGHVELRRLPKGGAWELVAPIPAGLPGVPQPDVLAADPNALGLEALAFHKRVWLLARGDDDAVRTLYWDDQKAKWQPWGEALAPWWHQQSACVGPGASGCQGDQNSGCTLFACAVSLGTWTPRPAQALRPRLHATTGGGLVASWQSAYVDGVATKDDLFDDGHLFLARLARAP